MSSIYNTIASRNGAAAADFCNQNGYDVANEQDIEMVLENLIANAEDKEAAFAAVMELHPDKETIIEIYTTRSDFDCGPLTDCGQRLASIKQTNLGKGNDGSTSGMKTPNLYPQILTSTNIILTICAIAIIVAIASKS